MSLDAFTPAVRDWFAGAFAGPTAVQEQAWPLISAGEHVLISAPTGSGKTLAAFLWGLDRLAASPLPDDRRRVRLLYVSPLKALSHDVDRNLRAPLRGILARSPDHEIRVGLRTGDTPQRDRQAMRRRPPDVLITTPESLFLMLTSGAREILTGVETVIVDEIHAVAGTKRGSHLALTLERLAQLRRDAWAADGAPDGAWAGEEVQRIGLSATQNPLEEVGRFLVGPSRRCRIVDTGERKAMDLRIQVPVESLTELDGIGAAVGGGARQAEVGAGGRDPAPGDAALDGSADADGAPTDPPADGSPRPGQAPEDGGPGADGAKEDAHAGPVVDPLDPLPGGGEATRNSIWPAMYPQILDLVEQHRSTIVFVNSRRSAERLALRLNELAERRALDAEAAAAAGDPSSDPDARWDPDAPADRPPGELRRLAPDLEATPGEARAPGEVPRGAPDLEATLPGPERHARLAPRPVVPLESAGVAGSHTAVVGANGPRSRPPNGPRSRPPNGPRSRPPTPAGPHAIEVARAHHGSLSREERETVEELLKAGELPCLVATSSLELGIDMGAVDLVLQIESPKSVAAGMQRIGRAGHGVGEVAKGRIFPKFRADLLECAVVARRMREGLIEPIAVPRNALDVLAQQIVAIAAASDDGQGTAGEDEGLGDGIAVDDLHALVTRTHSYAELPRELLERVLDMLDGRYPSQEFADLRPRIVWDRLGGTIRPRRGARRLAIANAGTIPDRGLYRVTLPDGRRVGELDEEMVYEARAGQTFLLGASTWRIEEIQRDRVVVTPAPGVPGAVPFWRGDQRGRPIELGRAIGAFARWAVDQPEQALVDDYDLDERAARNLLDFLREQQEATRVLPSDRALVVERFRDEIGDWRLCLLSPFGGRVHAAWGLAAARRIREERGIEADAIWSDDGIIVHLPEADEPPSAELLLLDPDEAEDLIVAELGSSALFGARFRENAGRALLIPRAQPGRRTPLWQQRLKAQTLLEVASRFRDFPVILETYRECLRDVLDVPGLLGLLRQIDAREVAVVEAETATASPMASSLLFDYVATYMYEGDAPNAERRAAALSLDRDLLRELLGQDELRELLDAGALARLEADLQHRSAKTVARSVDGLAEVLRRVGDLTVEEVAARVAADGVEIPDEGLPTVEAVGGGRALDPAAPAFAAQLARAEQWLAALADQRRAIALRVGGQSRWIAADDAGLYRDALGAVPPGGLPEAFLADVVDPLRRLVVRYAATHGPFTDHELRARLGVDPGSVLRELLREEELVRGEIRPDPPRPTETEWCDPDVLRRLRRMSLAALRQEIEPADPRALVGFATGWHGIDRHRRIDGRDGRGVERLREALVPLQGLALPVELWERDVLPRRLGGYQPAWLDGLCASGEVVWVAAGGTGSGRVALYFRDDAAAIGPPVGSALAALPARDAAPSALAGPLHAALRERLDGRALFFDELLDAAPEDPVGLRDALWDLIWAGEVTCDLFAPLRAGRGALRPAKPSAPAPASAARHGASRPGRRRFGPRPAATARAATQGRFSLTAPLFAGPEAADPGARRRTVAELLLERHGIVTREHVRAERIPGGFATLYDSFGALETLGTCRRGYFVEGLGGAQFALPGAVERLRAQRVEPPGPSTDAAGRPLPVLVIDAVDPAQPYGTLLPWPDPPEGDPERPADAKAPAPQRAVGAKVVLVGPDPLLFVERSGRGIQVLVRYDDERLPIALAELVRAVADGRVTADPRKGLQLERLDGVAALGHPLEPLLEPAGFRPAATKYVARR